MPGQDNQNNKYTNGRIKKSHYNSYLQNKYGKYVKVASLFTSAGASVAAFFILSSIGVAAFTAPAIIAMTLAAAAVWVLANFAFGIATSVKSKLSPSKTIINAFDTIFNAHEVSKLPSFNPDKQEIIFKEEPKDKSVVYRAYVQNKPVQEKAV